jgi:hypothetical protein
MFEPSKLFVFFSVNICIEIGGIVPHLLQIFQHEMNNSSFSSPFIVNFEPIEQNFNSIFVNKYSKK